MIPEYKNLVIKDITARLSYGVKCKILETNETKILASVNYYRENILFDFWEDERKIQYDYQLYLSEFKPYLFPLSSMTEEQKSYIHFNTKFRITRFGNIDVKIDEDENYFDVDESDWLNLFDWLNKNHIDYRGLIEKDLAIDCTNLNIY